MGQPFEGVEHAQNQQRLVPASPRRRRSAHVGSARAKANGRRCQSLKASKTVPSTELSKYRLLRVAQVYNEASDSRGGQKPKLKLVIFCVSKGCLFY